MSLHGSDVHHKISSERHYTKIVSIAADISSDVHYKISSERHYTQNSEYCGRH